MKHVKAVDDFFEGVDDCKKGVKHSSGRSAEYDRGYNTQYQAEQIGAARS